jgi:hypothetical protein
LVASRIVLLFLLFSSQIAVGQSSWIKLPSRFTVEAFDLNYSQVLVKEADSVVGLNNEAIAYSQFGNWYILDRTDTFQVDSFKVRSWSAYSYWENGKSYLRGGAIRNSFDFDYVSISEDGAWARGTDSVGLLQVHLPSGRQFRAMAILDGQSIEEPIRCFNDRLGYYFIDWKSVRLSHWNYVYAENFTNGISIAELNRRYGGLNRAGEWQIKPRYSWLIRVKGNRFIGKTDSVFQIIDEFGKNIWAGKDSIYKADGFVGRVDSLGLLGAIDYSGCELFSGYKYGVVKDQNQYIADAGTYMCIKDTNGAVMFGPKTSYSMIESGSEGLFRVKKNGKYGFANKEGIKRIQYRYEATKALTNGKVPVKIQNRWGVITNADQIVVQPIYSYVSNFCGNICCAELAEKWYIFDSSGRSIFFDGCNQVQETSSGGYILQQNGKFGYINADGTVLLQPFYQEIQEVTSQIIKARLGNFWAVYDGSGNLKLAGKYQKIHSDLSAGYIFLYK